jgi:hypothetical protein
MAYIRLFSWSTPRTENAKKKCTHKKMQMMHKKHTKNAKTITQQMQKNAKKCIQRMQKAHIKCKKMPERGF